MGEDAATGATRAGRLDRLKGWALRRRTLVSLGVAIAVLIVFVGVPGYVATRPAFVQRYARLGAEYLSWSHSVHAKVPCQSCHVPPDRFAQLSYDASMLGEFYVSILLPGHEPALFAKPTNAACQSCHTDLRTVSPSGDLNIPHRAHVEVLKLNCIDCHSYLVHTANREGTNKPRMADCLKCHDGRTAKSECSACHTDKVQPLSHRAPDWLAVHARKASAGECGKCHAWTTHWCADCHAKRPRSHGADWRSQHGAAVRKDRDCEACHAAAFCIRCHGVVPKPNLDPSLKLVQ